MPTMKTITRLSREQFESYDIENKSLGERLDWCAELFRLMPPYEQQVLEYFVRNLLKYAPKLHKLTSYGVKHHYQSVMSLLTEVPKGDLYITTHLMDGALYKNGYRAKKLDHTQHLAWFYEPAFNLSLDAIKMKERYEKTHRFETRYAFLPALPLHPVMKPKRRLDLLVNLNEKWYFLARSVSRDGANRVLESVKADGVTIEEVPTRERIDTVYTDVLHALNFDLIPNRRRVCKWAQLYFEKRPAVF